MPRTPSELRADGRAWLNALGKRHPLHRRTYLVPGICNEDAAMWDAIWSWGTLTIPNWGDYAQRIKFTDVTPNSDFIAFGDHVRKEIGRTYPFDPADPVGEYDIVTYSMGGLDAFAAMVPLAPSSFDTVPRMGKAYHLLTLDTPFGGVPNWALRKGFPDIASRPDRQTQCDALAPHSPQLASLRAARAQLAGCVERIACYSAGGDSAIQVPVTSSNLCNDARPASLWGTAIQYGSYLIPGASHGGDSAIYDNEFAIASVFGQLLFAR